MQRLIFALVLSVLCFVPVQAQEEYQLHTPDAEEFLKLLSDLSIYCNWDEPQPNSIAPWNFCDYFIYQISILYQDDLIDLPFDLLLDTYDTLQPGNGWYSRGNAKLWNKTLILSWIRDNDIDLDSTTSFTFAHLDISVESRDFNADGIDEYVLTIDSWQFSTYMVLSQQSDGTYNDIANSLPYHIDAPYMDRQSSYLHEIAFDDFNADGLPEWLLAFDGASYRGDYLGEVLLLGWRDGELQPVDKYSIKYIPYFDTNANELTRNDIEDGYLFTNLDDDPALELQAIDITADNWHCKQSNSVVYDWSPEEDAYIKIRESIKRENSANCVINDADNALYDGNYTAASHLYKYALTLPFETYYPSDTAEFIKEMQQFVQLRLVQSYLLNREYEAANQILESIDRQDLISQMTQDLYNILITHRYAEPVETCTAIFNLFEYATYSAYNYNSFQEHIGTDLTVGVPWKFAGDFIGAGNPADPAFGGCNISDQIDKMLEGYTVYPPVSKTFIENMQKRGFLVRNYINADFNGDGDNDWLIWHEANVPAVLYLTNQDNQPLELSRVRIRQDSDQSLIEAITLPENSGIGIVQLQAGQDLPSYYGGYTCDESVSFLGSLDIWQYVDNELTTTLYTTWCDDYPTVDSMFDEVDGNSIMYFHERQTGEVIEYTWDTESGRYIPPSEPQETTSEVQSNSVTLPESTPTNEELHYWLGDGIKDYYLRLDEQISNAGDITSKIAILDAEIDAPYMDYPYTLQYWKATILLNAGLDDEALEEFIEIYEATPDSFWGQLAHLHFEKVDS